MSLSDRFSSMRATGINTNDATATPGDIVLGMTAYASGQKLVGTLDVGAGYDLTRIGTTVTAQATSAIPKGARWKGVRNTSSTPIVGKQAIGNSMPYKTSADGVVGYRNLSYNSDTTTDYIRIFNPITSVYDSFAVDVTSAVAELQLASGTSYQTYSEINTNGTLIIIFVYSGSGSSATGETNRKKIITIEVDRINKIGTAYVSTFEAEHIRPTGLTMINDYLFRNNYYNTTASDGTSLYKYNWVTHVFDYLEKSPNASFFYYGQDSFTPSSLAIIDDYTFLIVFPYSDAMGSRIHKIVIDPTTNLFTTTSVTVPRFTTSYYPAPTISPDGQMVVASQRMSTSGSPYYQANLYSLNYQDMTLALIDEAFIYSQSLTGRQYVSDNAIITNLGAYEFDGTSCTQIDQTNFNGTSTTPMFNSHRFFRENGTNSYIGSVSNSSGEYLISFDSSYDTEADTAYGIASSTMNVGDVGNAQLLWTNINGGGS